MPLMIRFGAWSTILAVLAVQIALLSGLLLRGRANRLANLYLAVLLLVIVGLMTPFVLGYAGFYDAYPWLTAAPFAIPLAVGPLFYAHVRALAEDRPIRLAHFAAPAVQFLYQTALFPFPVADKFWWDVHVHEPLIGPPLALIILVSMIAYGVASWRQVRRYESWLAERRRSRKPARRIRLAAVLLTLLVSARAAYDLFDALVRPTNYFDLFAYYVLLGIVGLLLGLNGWRESASAAPAIAGANERDWTAQAEAWLVNLRESGWWRDPDLDLPTLARHLGTNTGHLSRALNAGSSGFAQALGTIRAEAVAEAIDSGSRDDLLTLALAAGFGSKASFNRAFSARYAMSPSAYRQQRQRLSA